LWDPESCIGEPPIHDHPSDFTSMVIAGEITNTRYEESPAGIDYERDRDAPGHEVARVVDTVPTALVLQGAARTRSSSRSALR